MQLIEQFRQPENFDVVADGSGWRLYSGCNDWEIAPTACAVVFPGDDRNERVWFTVDHKKCPEEEKFADETKAFGQKAWKTWKRVAAEQHKAKEGRSWKDAFKLALKEPAMKTYVRDSGTEHTRWKDVEESAATAVSRLLEDEHDDVKSEIDRLLPTKTYRLGGNDMLHAPGVVQIARTRWLEKSRKAKDHAMRIMKCWPGLPDEVCLAVLNGTAKVESDGHTAVVTVREY